jgi:hypothetical protein
VGRGARPGGAGGRGAAAADAGMHGEKARTKAWGARARAERTRNMEFMFVTPDMFQLEMSALKFFKSWKSSLMSVMAETHQSAMGPYVAMAEAAFESNSVTAVFREALLVKVWVQAPVGGEVGGGGGEGGGGGGLGLGGNGVVQLPGAQLEPYSEGNFGLPANAQRMDSLLAADRLLLVCRESKGGGVRWGTRCAPGSGRPWSGGAAQAACMCTGKTRLKAWGTGHARGAPGICLPCSWPWTRPS